MAISVLFLSAIPTGDRLVPLRDILADEDYQTAWPEEVVESPAFEIPGLGALLGILFVIGVIGLVVALIRRSLETRRLRHVSARPDSIKLSAGRPGSTGSDPSAELAAEGRFTEAIHVLFLRALAEIERATGGDGSGQAFRDSLTGREVVRVARLDESLRAPLTVLSQAVERSIFGGTDSSESDYHECVTSAADLLDRIPRIRK